MSVLHVVYFTSRSTHNHWKTEKTTTTKQKLHELPHTDTQKKRLGQIMHKHLNKTNIVVTEQLIRQPDVVGRLKLSDEFFFLFFLPDHGSQQPRRGRPSNVYRRFGHMHHYYHWPIDLHYPSPNFYRGSKSAIFGLIAQQRSTLSLCSLETEQDIFTIFKLCV